MATGINAKIRAALHGYLGTLTLSPVHAVAWDNRTYKRVIGTPFLEPVVLPNKTDRAGVGMNAPRRHRGLYQVTVYSVEDVGDIASTEIADAIIEHFGPNVVIDREGVRVRIGSYDGGDGVAYAGRSFNENGWRVTPVTVPWWCDVA